MAPAPDPAGVSVGVSMRAWLSKQAWRGLTLGMLAGSGYLFYRGGVYILPAAVLLLLTCGIAALRVVYGAAKRT